MSVTETKGTVSVKRLGVETIGRAHNLLVNAIEEDKMRDVDLIWNAYVNVELSIGIMKFIVGSPRVGKKRKLVASKKNDVLLLPAEQLKAKIELINHELEECEHEFAVGSTEHGLTIARKARDELKLLLLGSGRKSIKKTKAVQVAKS